MKRIKRMLFPTFMFLVLFTFAGIMINMTWMQLHGEYLIVGDVQYIYAVIVYGGSLFLGWVSS